MKLQLPLRAQILLGLVLVAGAVLLYDLLAQGKAPNSPSSSGSAAAKPSAAPVSAATSTTSLPRPSPSEPPMPNAPWQRDPFAIDPRRMPRTDQAEAFFAHLKVSGIVWGPEGFNALVNDHVVRPGDFVEGARIVRITKKGVEVEKDGQTRFLPLTQAGSLP
ncbi:MAG: hypothetical protein ACE5I9_01345 [Candidatus Methylomirabilales bacterium]